MSDQATARRTTGAALGRAPEPAPVAAPAVPGPAVLGPGGPSVLGPAAGPPAGDPAPAAVPRIAAPAFPSDPASDPAAAFTGAIATRGAATRAELAAQAAARAEPLPRHPVDTDGRVPRPVIGAAALLGAALAAVPFILAATRHDARPRPRPAPPAASFQQQVSPPGVIPSQASGDTP